MIINLTLLCLLALFSLAVALPTTEVKPHDIDSLHACGAKVTECNTKDKSYNHNVW
jgi:hypothetical protein